MKTTESRFIRIRNRISFEIPWLVIGIITLVGTLAVYKDVLHDHTIEEIELEQQVLKLVDKELEEKTRNRVYRSEIEELLNLNPDLIAPDSLKDGTWSTRNQF